MIEVHYIALNKIENGRCPEADKKLTELAGTGRIFSVMPYTVPVQGAPRIGTGGQLLAGPMQIVHTLVVVLEKENQ